MAKFMRLINNEWRKLFFKAGTWIMIALVCFLALCATALSFFGNMLFSSILSDYSMESYFSSEIAYYEDLLESADANAPEDVLNWKIELTYYQLLLELGIASESDWRYASGAVHEAAELQCMGDPLRYQEYLKAIEADDPNQYYALQKEMLGEIYFGERLEIYTEALDYCMQNNVIPSPSVDGRYALIETVIKNKEILLAQKMLQESGGAWSSATVEKAKNELAIAEYQMEHNMLINPADSFSDDMSDLYMGEGIKQTSPFWDNLKFCVGLISIIAYFSIVIAGNMIAKEYASGTVKFLLIAPVKRRKILFSKYATVLLVAILMLVLLFGVSLLASLVFGVKDLFLPALYAEDGIVTLSSPMLMLMGEYGLAFLQVVVMATLAFAISAMTRSASLAVGIGLVCYMMGSVFTSILQAMGLDGARYLIFANLDLGAIASGTSMFPHQSLPVAIVIIIAHLAVFLLTAHDAFVKREI